MAILRVHNASEKLYKGIQKLAEKENRSVTAEVIQMMNQDIETREARRGEGPGETAPS